MLSIFGVMAFAIDGFAHAAEALVGEAIGQKNKLMLTIVIQRTSYLAGMMAIPAEPYYGLKAYSLDDQRPI